MNPAASARPDAGGNSVGSDKVLYGIRDMVRGKMSDIDLLVDVAKKLKARRYALWIEAAAWPVACRDKTFQI